MVRKIVVSLWASLAFASAAYSADMPVRATPVPYQSALYNWTGAYVGVNAGYGWGRFSDDVGGINVRGFVGGGQIGYNWQAGNLVYGLETDFQGSGQSAAQIGFIGATAVSTSERIRYFGTIRGRIGFAMDRWLAYFTGGFAYVNGGVDLTVAGTTASGNTTKGGGTLGLGTEYAFAGPWTAGLEYLYIDTGTRSVTVLGVTDNVRTRDNVLRGKLNYRF